MNWNGIIIDLLLLLLPVLFFFGAKFIKPARALDTEGCLSIDTCRYYRGFFAVVIVLHHLSQRTEAGTVFRYLDLIGYFPVAVFFFLSGYGLQKSYITKSDSYRKGFLLKRIPAVLIPYAAVTLIRWLMSFAGVGQAYSFGEIFTEIMRGAPILLFSWYIIAIIVFYAVYWLLMLICRKHYLLMIVGAAVWFVLHTLFCLKMEYGNWWYKTSHLLIVGMIWATYEGKILEFIKKRYFVIAPAVWASFACLFVLQNKVGILMNNKYLNIVAAMLSSLLFVIGFLLFTLKVRIGNKTLGFLGGISLEIYLAQGLLVAALRSDLLYIGNDLLWIVAVLAGTVAAAFVLHLAFSFILKKYKGLLGKLRI